MPPHCASNTPCAIRLPLHLTQTLAAFDASKLSPPHLARSWGIHRQHGLAPGWGADGRHGLLSPTGCKEHYGS
eukprot:5235093-Lingulodinium_polyedra.AAC.1